MFCGTIKFSRERGSFLCCCAPSEPSTCGSPLKPRYWRAGPGQRVLGTQTPSSTSGRANQSANGYKSSKCYPIRNQTADGSFREDLSACVAVSMIRWMVE